MFTVMFENAFVSNDPDNCSVDECNHFANFQSLEDALMFARYIHRRPAVTDQYGDMYWSNVSCVIDQLSDIPVDENLYMSDDGIAQFVMPISSDEILASDCGCPVDPQYA